MSEEAAKLNLSFHLGTETQIYLSGHSKACAGCCLKINGKTNFPEWIFHT